MTHRNANTPTVPAPLPRCLQANQEDEQRLHEERMAHRKAAEAYSDEVKALQGQVRLASCLLCCATKQACMLHAWGHMHQCRMGAHAPVSHGATCTSVAPACRQTRCMHFRPPCACKTHANSNHAQLAAAQDGAAEAHHQVAAARSEVHVLLADRAGGGQQLRARTAELQVGAACVLAVLHACTGLGQHASWCVHATQDLPYPNQPPNHPQPTGHPRQKQAALSSRDAEIADLRAALSARDALTDALEAGLKRLKQQVAAVRARLKRQAAVAEDCERRTLAAAAAGAALTAQLAACRGEAERALAAAAAAEGRAAAAEAALAAKRAAHAAAAEGWGQQEAALRAEASAAAAAAAAAEQSREEAQAQLADEAAQRQLDDAQAAGTADAAQAAQQAAQRQLEEERAGWRAEREGLEGEKRRLLELLEAFAKQLDAREALLADVEGAAAADDGDTCSDDEQLAGKQPPAAVPAEAVAVVTAKPAVVVISKAASGCDQGGLEQRPQQPEEGKEDDKEQLAADQLQERGQDVEMEDQQAQPQQQSDEAEQEPAAQPLSPAVAAPLPVVAAADEPVVVMDDGLVGKVEAPAAASEEGTAGRVNADGGGASKRLRAADGGWRPAATPSSPCPASPHHKSAAAPAPPTDPSAGATEDPAANGNSKAAGGRAVSALQLLSLRIGATSSGKSSGSLRGASNSSVSSATALPAPASLADAPGGGRNAHLSLLGGRMGLMQQHAAAAAAGGPLPALLRGLTLASLAINRPLGAAVPAASSRLLASPAGRPGQLDARPLAPNRPTSTAASSSRPMTKMGSSPADTGAVRVLPAAAELARPTAVPPAAAAPEAAAAPVASSAGGASGASGGGGRVGGGRFKQAVSGGGGVSGGAVLGAEGAAGGGISGGGLPGGGARGGSAKGRGGATGAAPVPTVSMLFASMMGASDEDEEEDA
jgi:hypothetical protein